MNVVKLSLVAAFDPSLPLVAWRWRWPNLVDLGFDELDFSISQEAPSVWNPNYAVSDINHHMLKAIWFDWLQREVGKPAPNGKLMPPYLVRNLKAHWPSQDRPLLVSLLRRKGGHALG